MEDEYKLINVRGLAKMLAYERLSDDYAHTPFNLMYKTQTIDGENVCELREEFQRIYDIMIKDAEEEILEFEKAK